MPGLRFFLDSQEFSLALISLLDLSSMSWLTLWNTFKWDVLLVRGANLAANCYLLCVFDSPRDLKPFFYGEWCRLPNGRAKKSIDGLDGYSCIFINVYLILYRDSSFVSFLSLGNRHNAARYWKSPGKDGKVIGIMLLFFIVVKVTNTFNFFYFLSLVVQTSWRRESCFQACTRKIWT